MRVLFLISKMIIFGLLTANGQWQPSAGTSGVWGMTQKDTSIFAGTSNAIQVSGDYGISWASQSAPGFVRNILVRDSMLFITAPAVYRSSDNGATWQSANAGIANPSTVWSITQTDSLLIVGTSGSFGGDTASIYISSDNGDSWSRVFTLGNFDVFYSFAVSGSEVFAGVLPSGVFYSKDKGASWTMKNGPLAAKHIGRADTNLLCGISGGSGGIYLSGDKGATWTNTLPLYYGYTFATSGSLSFAGTSNGFYYSMDNGYTWINDNSGLPPATSVISICVAGSFIFIGTSTAGIFRRNIEDIITRTDDVQHHEADITVGPNPFYRYVTVSGTRPNGVISITNLSGNIVHTQVSTDNKTEVCTDQLKPGIYFLTYNTGIQSASFTMAKL